MELKPFSVVKYVDRNGVASAAIKRKLPNGTDVVLVKKANLPNDKAIAMSFDTFVKSELPRVDITKK